MNELGSLQVVDGETLRAWLIDGEELALLDAREEGVFFQAHLFHAANVPLSKLELLLGDLVPRLDTRLVWCDDGASGLAGRAASRAGELGWTNQFVLTGGTTAWAAAGGELYGGINVPSKAFGEFVEHRYGTPRLAAAEVAALLDSDTDVIVLDSRPLPEFQRMSIPGGIDCPGAELVPRVKELVHDPDTLVVVNCAGRTRSILGAQSLINAGLENRVVALENGTMGWQLAGFDIETAAEQIAPPPSETSRAWAQERAEEIRTRFGVQIVDESTLQAWLADTDRTTYLLDVRSPEEFEADHRPGTANAPGGQLVQATDSYVATRNARLVLLDDDGVRASMTASWLRQMGWNDAVVLEPAPRTGASGSTSGSRWSPDPLHPLDTADFLAGARPNATVLDFSSSLTYRRRGHIPGAHWVVRSRLAEAAETIGPLVGADADIVVTSSDGVMAVLAAPDVANRWPEATVSVLVGGNRAWVEAGGEVETGLTSPTTLTDDIWYKPYDHDDGEAERHMQEYLTWEVALVDQLDRDPTVHFPDFD